jgi:uncharacterized protein (TIGR04255 family)
MSEKNSSGSHRVNYSRAPITESVISVQFADPVPPEVLGKLKTQLSAEYPFAEGWAELAVTFDAATQTTSNQEMNKGYKFATLDRLDVLIVTNNRISVSRLAPYTGWEQFSARARRDWDLFKRLTGFRKLSQIGVRYINRVDIPFPEKPGAPFNADEYLLIGPTIPQPPFPPMESSTMQVRCPTELGEIVCNNARVPSPLVNHHSFVLDIDIIRRVNVPQSDDELWIYIDQVRDQKNMLFEACITDKARALFR